MSAGIDGGPAFPVESYDHESGMDTVKPGMSLRDWFAGKALVAMMSVPEIFELEIDGVSDDCYKWADAMLAARDGKGDA